MVVSLEAETTGVHWRNLKIQKKVTLFISASAKHVYEKDLKKETNLTELNAKLIMSQSKHSISGSIHVDP